MLGSLTRPRTTRESESLTYEQLEQDIAAWRAELSAIGQQRAALQNRLASSCEEGEHGAIQRAILALDMSKQRLIWSIRESEQELRAQRRRPKSLLGTETSAVRPMPQPPDLHASPPNSAPAAMRARARTPQDLSPFSLVQSERLEYGDLPRDHDSVDQADAPDVASQLDFSLTERSPPKDGLQSEEFDTQVASRPLKPALRNATQRSSRPINRRVQFSSPHRPHPTRESAFSLPVIGSHYITDYGACYDFDDTEWNDDPACVFNEPVPAVEDCIGESPERYDRRGLNHKNWDEDEWRDHQVNHPQTVDNLNHFDASPPRDLDRTHSSVGAAYCASCSDAAGTPEYKLVLPPSALKPSGSADSSNDELFIDSDVHHLVPEQLDFASEAYFGDIRTQQAEWRRAQALDSQEASLSLKAAEDVNRLDLQASPAYAHYPHAQPANSEPIETVQHGERAPAAPQDAPQSRTDQRDVLAPTDELGRHEADKLAALETPEDERLDSLKDANITTGCSLKNLQPSQASSVASAASESIGKVASSSSSIAGSASLSSPRRLTSKSKPFWEIKLERKARQQEEQRQKHLRDQDYLQAWHSTDQEISEQSSDPLALETTAATETSRPSLAVADVEAGSNHASVEQEMLNTRQVISATALEAPTLTYDAFTPTICVLAR